MEEKTFRIFGMEVRIQKTNTSGIWYSVKFGGKIGEFFHVPKPLRDETLEVLRELAKYVEGVD